MSENKRPHSLLDGVGRPLPDLFALLQRERLAPCNAAEFAAAAEAAVSEEEGGAGLLLHQGSAQCGK